MGGHHQYFKLGRFFHNVGGVFVPCRFELSSVLAVFYQTHRLEEEWCAAGCMGLLRTVGQQEVFSRSVSPTHTSCDNGKLEVISLRICKKFRRVISDLKNLLSERLIFYSKLLSGSNSFFDAHSATRANPYEATIVQDKGVAFF